MEEKMDKARIMLCEDDENLGMLLREYLEAMSTYASMEKRALKPFSRRNTTCAS